MVVLMPQTPNKSTNESVLLGKKKAGTSVAILQSNYIPWKGYFDLINSVDEFVIYDDVQYTRRDWRNRNKVKTKDGLLWLTIPVEVKGKYEQKIKETKVAEGDWAKRHFESFLHHYKKAEYFEQYKPILAELYEEAGKLEYLSDVNYLFLSRICELLAITTPLRRSHEFKLVEGQTERLFSICAELNAGTYVSGPAAKAYLDNAIFAEHGINVHWYDYSGYREYPQMHPPFEHGVTVFDLLLNCGPSSAEYMLTFGKEKI
jgi:hypothetical protein